MLVVLILVVEGPESRQAYAWQLYLFFSFLAFLLQILLECKEFSDFNAKDIRSFLMRSSQQSLIEKACDLAMVKSASQLPYKQHWSILYRINGCWRLVFISASIAFLTNFSQLLYSCPRYSIWAFIDALRSLRKNCINLDSSKVPSLSNSWRMDSRCSRWETQSYTTSY